MYFGYEDIMYYIYEGHSEDKHYNIVVKSNTLDKADKMLRKYTLKHGLQLTNIMLDFCCYTTDLPSMITTFDFGDVIVIK